jgi:hypothetical protein
MRRRRFLVLAALAVGGCTGDYRTSGPRPRNRRRCRLLRCRRSNRAQAVIRPLNEAYRILRDPLDGFEVADLSRDDRSAAEASIATACEAATAFSTAVTDAPAAYRSLPTLVTAHVRLLDAATVAVDLYASLASLDAERVVDSSARVARFASAGDELRTIAETEPTVPPALFLSVARMRRVAAALARHGDVARAEGRFRTAEETRDRCAER